MRTFPGSLAGISAALGLALGLGGCVGPSGPAVYSIDDLRGLIEEQDGLATLDFDPSEVTTTAAVDAETMAGYWEHSSGEPEECFPIYGTSYLLAGTEDDAGGDDPTMELATFREPGAGDRGLVIVNGRIFDDTAGAAAFLESVEEFAKACGGYTLKDDAGEVVWSVGGFGLGTFSGVPDGVASLTSQEQVDAAASPEQKTTFLQRGNAVLAFYAETYDGGTFVIDDIDDVIVAVAERFAAVS
jgi:hypothetical protein